jgi:large subunit ribosomal protein L13Ae
MLQTIVIDARAHMLGRLASVVAKQILSGYQIVSVPLSRGCFSFR